MSSADTAFARLALAAAALALVVVVLGAYVRLTDAGLGCPDWPGCYGRWTPPAAAELEGAAARADASTGKARREMAHRYAAGLLAIAIAALFAMAGYRRDRPGLPAALTGLVILQALLGMWTVTWQLKPVVVVAHLLGGLATLGMLVWLVLRANGYSGPPQPPGRGIRAAALAGLAVLIAQIALGGWTSANYAAVACLDFPTCQGRWWPEMDFREAFTLWRGLGVSYEGGVLDHDARLAIHVSHRLGAVLAGTYLLVLGALLTAARGASRMRRVGGALLIAVLAQIALGIGTVTTGRPLALAVAHNAGAAVLVAVLVTVNYLLWTRRPVRSSGADA